MNPSVAILGAGAMGAAVARRLADHGIIVTTVLEGRSDESVKRAEDAHMRNVPLARIGDADIVFSIVPPGVAVAVAEQLAPVLGAAARKPVYVDCNAVSPKTAQHIGTIIATTGAAFVDGGIVGGPPQPGQKGATFYLSGERAAYVARLSEFGLATKVLGGPPGAASALKMSYAGITKGLTALASVMILGASRAGMDEVLRAELAESQPQLLAWFTRQVPAMFPKAYRWVVEMDEIAAFVDEDDAGHRIFDGAAELYRRIAGDFAGGQAETQALDSFFRASKAP